MHCVVELSRVNYGYSTYYLVMPGNSRKSFGLTTEFRRYFQMLIFDAFIGRKISDFLSMNHSELAFRKLLSCTDGVMLHVQVHLCLESAPGPA